jgi:hypothetical protein
VRCFLVEVFSGTSTWLYTIQGTLRGHSGNIH